MDDTNTATKDEASNPKPKEQNQLKVAYTWTDDETEKLISEVKCRPCIWNAHDKEYNMRRKRKKAWYQVFNAFGGNKTGDHLRNKWRILCSQYHNSVASVSKTKSGPGAPERLQWKFHGQMAFVDAAKRAQNVRLESISTNGPGNPGGAPENMELCERMKYLYSNGNGLKSKITMTPCTPGTSGVPTRKRTSSVDQTACNSEKRERLMSSVQCATPDDIQTFANYLASELRRIKSGEYQKSVQQQLLELAWKLIAEQPAVLS